MSQFINDIQVGRGNRSKEQFPSKEVILEIIKGAASVPSGDNCQPFYYEWNGQVLSVFVDHDRSAHELNKNEHPTLISLGCAIEAITIIASQHQLIPSVSYEFSDVSRSKLWATIRFKRATIQPSDLAEAVLKRSTDRRPYFGGSFEDGVFDRVLESNLNQRKCSIHLAKVSKKMEKYFVLCDQFSWKNVAVVKDLLAHFRLSKKEVESNSDGMSSEDIDLNPIDTLIFRLIRRFPALPKLFWGLGFGMAIKIVTKKWLRKSTGLVVFTINDVKPKSLVELGRVSYRSWLILNDAGYGVHPLSAPFIPVIDNKADCLTSKEMKLFYDSGEEFLKRELKLSKGEIPAWSFRVGKIKKGLAKSPAKKRDFTSLIRFV